MHNTLNIALHNINQSKRFARAAQNCRVAFCFVQCTACTYQSFIKCLCVCVVAALAAIVSRSVSCRQMTTQPLPRHLSCAQDRVVKLASRFHTHTLVRSCECPQSCILAVRTMRFACDLHMWNTFAKSTLPFIGATACMRAWSVRACMWKDQERRRQGIA